MTFLGDEGRDMILIRRIFTELHPPLIGPGTSVGSMYLGPLYYYLMAIPLLVFGFSPVGPSVAVAVFSIFTIFFIWWAGREWFGKHAGLFAVALYAISPVVIYYSRSSWNPNVMPFFSFICIYSVWKVWREGKYNWLVVLGISFAFVLQSHYLGLLLIPTLFLFWFLSFRNLRMVKDPKKEIKNFWKKTLLGIGSFLFLMSPLLIFDLRHGFVNFNAVRNFFTGNGNIVTFDPFSAFLRIPNLFSQINHSLLSGASSVPGSFVLVSTFLVLGLFMLINFFVVGNSKKDPKKNISGSACLLVVVWFFLGLLGLGFYNQAIYDHYLGFIFPAPFLLTGLIISKLTSGRIFLKFLGYAILLYLIVINLVGNPLRKDPNRLLQRSINVAEVIKENFLGEPFNLAVIAETNYEAGYKYFLLKDYLPVVDIDSQRKDTITDQLFVVCELLPTTRCDPTHSAKAEVANFGWSVIDRIWEVDGILVYKLVHSDKLEI